MIERFYIGNELIKVEIHFPSLEHINKAYQEFYFEIARAIGLDEIKISSVVPKVEQLISKSLAQMLHVLLETHKNLITAPHFYLSINIFPFSSRNYGGYQKDLSLPNHPVIELYGGPFTMFLNKFLKERSPEFHRPNYFMMDLLKEDSLLYKVLKHELSHHLDRSLLLAGDKVVKSLERRERKEKSEYNGMSMMFNLYHQLRVEGVATFLGEHFTRRLYLPDLMEFAKLHTTKYECFNAHSGHSSGYYMACVIALNYVRKNYPGHRQSIKDYISHLKVKLNANQECVQNYPFPGGIDFVKLDAFLQSVSLEEFLYLFEISCKKLKLRKHIFVSHKTYKKAMKRMYLNYLALIEKNGLNEKFAKKAATEQVASWKEAA